MTKMTFAITFLAMTLLMMPATSGTAYANHTITVSPSGEATVAFNDNCYAFIADSLSFGDADTDAATKTVNGISGHLATYASGAEEAASDASGANANGWIGFTQDTNFHPIGGAVGDGSLSDNIFNDAGWGWVTGEPVVYTNWKAGEPNDSGVEDYAENNDVGLQWNDIAVGPQPGYYVEFDGACIESEIVCDGSDQICKTVHIEQATPDGVIEVNEHVIYTIVIDVINNSGNLWSGVTVHDRFAGDLAVGDTGVPKNPAPHAQDDDILSVSNLDCDDDSLTQKGKTQKEFLDCAVSGDGDLSIGESASVGVIAETDYNPGQGKKTPGKQSYTSCGVHTINSGASTTFTIPGPTEVTLQTPAVSVDVFELADLSGDCDMDGISDADELNDQVNTCLDPFNPDSDGDTINDGTEVANGTDPCNPDTDGDGFNDNVDPCPLISGTLDGCVDP